MKRALPRRGRLLILTGAGAAALLLTDLFFAARVSSYPAAVRYGYLNCASCHHNVAGGGLLNDYGRAVTQDVLSTWGRDGEADFAYGKVVPTDGVDYGGDLRLVQASRKSGPSRDNFRVTQMEFETAVTDGPRLLLASVGRREAADGVSDGARWVSPRHYLQFNAGPEWSFRAGRFFPVYGVWNADYASPTRAALRMGAGFETYNAEANWVGRRWSASLAGLFGRPDAKALNRDKGATATVSAGLGRRAKAGASVARRANDDARRTSAGPFAMIGLTPRLYLLSEVDALRTQPRDGRPSWGMASYQRLGREFRPGFFLLLTQKYGRTDFRTDKTSTLSHGLGLQWFPRPHWEAQTSYDWQQDKAVSSKIRGVLSLQLHFYL